MARQVVLRGILVRALAARIAGAIEAAFVIVGAGDEHRAVAAPFVINDWLNVFGPIHRRGAKEARSITHAHHEIALVGKADR